MNQPAFHNFSKEITAHTRAPAVSIPRHIGVFSMFGSANTVVSSAQSNQPSAITSPQPGEPVVVSLTPAEATLLRRLTQASTSFQEQIRREEIGPRWMLKTWLLNTRNPDQPKGRRTGPVQVLSKIVKDWQLSDGELAVLLAYSNAQSAADLLAGRISLRDPGREDRVRLMYHIYRVLPSIFPEASLQQAWLRGTNPNLSDKTPLEFMMQRRIPGMVSVQNLVERFAGR